MFKEYLNKLSNRFPEREVTQITELLQNITLTNNKKYIAFLHVVLLPGNNTLLHDAIYSGDLDLALCIIKLAPDLCRLKNNQGATPIHVLASNYSDEVVANFIKSITFDNIDILNSVKFGFNIQDNDGNSPISIAAFLEKNSAVNTMMYYGKLSDHSLVYSGTKEVYLGDLLFNLGKAKLDKQSKGFNSVDSRLGLIETNVDYYHSIRPSEALNHNNQIEFVVDGNNDTALNIPLSGDLDLSS